MKRQVLFLYSKNPKIHENLVLFSFLLLSLGSSGSVVFGQKVSKFLVWRLGENGFLPQIGGQVGVRLCNGSISCLGCKV